MQAVTPPLRWIEQLVVPVATSIIGGLTVSTTTFIVGKFDDRLDKVEAAVVQLYRSVDRLDSKLDRLDTKLSEKLDRLCGFGILGSLGGLALVAYLCKPRD